MNQLTHAGRDRRPRVQGAIHSLRFGSVDMPSLVLAIGLASVATAQGTLFTYTGTQPAGGAGAAVALWTDLDGDGRLEWVVGAPREDTTVVDAGRVHVLSGATGLTYTTIDGNVANGQVGDALANVGDLDGDGIDELAVGAPGERTVRVHSGATQAVLWTHTEASRSSFGAAVNAAGDVNGDGTLDVIVGAPLHGSVVVLSGVGGGVVFASQDPTLFRYGFSVASAGDIDGDGYGDVLAGAPNTFGGTYNEGAVAVLRGPAGAVAHVHRPSGSQDRGMEFGYSVAPAGDVDGDGLDDYAVGARYYGGLHFVDYNFVAVYSGLTHVELDRILGGYDHWFGESLASVGDIDQDGHAELAIGDPIGQEIVVWSPRRDVVVQRFTGVGFELAGASVAGGEDVDGDGFLDIVQGTHYLNSFGAIGPGRAAVFTVGCVVDAAYSYCVTTPNSASAVGARIAKLGSTSLSGSGMRLYATDCPTNTFALFFYGTQTALAPSGFGTVCVGGTVLRLYPASPTGPAGVPSHDFALSVLGVVAGDTRFFQCWVRDNQGGVVGHTFSDGLRVTFCP
jgi:hypothetical protein